MIVFLILDLGNVLDRWLLRDTSRKTIPTYLERTRNALISDKTEHSTLKYSRAKPPPPVSLTSFESSVLQSLGHW